MDTLLTHTFDCYPMNALWKKIGNELCDVVIMPMNGIWTSAGLASLFIIVSIAALTLTAKYLQRMNPAYDRQPMVTEPFQAASKYAVRF
ncbi:unnamed protein product [Anisakis simplex]|uniref:Carbon starvation protein A n=1 Tax=Anisakis simplex TaxID=6269 RepID=A0A0M3JWC7_ANISI|nr:unnamed protein product [Anisakis simplex]